MGPVVPFLSDSPAQLDAAVGQIAAAGAIHVTPIVLHLRPGTREWFFAWLRAQHPELVDRYLDLYGHGAYAPKAYQNRIAGQVRELADKYGIGRPGRAPVTAACPAGPSPGAPPSPATAARARDHAQPSGSSAQESLKPPRCPCHGDTPLHRLSNSPCSEQGMKRMWLRVSTRNSQCPGHIRGG